MEPKMYILDALSKFGTKDTVYEAYHQKRMLSFFLQILISPEMSRFLKEMMFDKIKWHRDLCS
jgi:hypothetical protein